MPLADVLSAMREIILDAPTLPSENSAREILFKERYPQLTLEEREDLARIDPAQFSVYTTSIFQSERSIVQNHMPLTYALLKELWTRAFSERFIGWRVIKLVHDSLPWSSQRPQMLLDNLAAWLAQTENPVRALRQDIAALAELEAAGYLLKRSPASFQAPSGRLDPEALSTITVEKLLTLSLTFSAPLASRKLTHDVLSMRQQHSPGDPVSELPTAPERDCFLLGTRTPSHTISWVEVPEGLYTLVSENNPAGISVEELALATVPESLWKNEQEALAFLLNQLALLLTHQIVTMTQS